MSGGKLMGILFLTTCHDDKFYKKADGDKEFHYQFCHKIYNKIKVVGTATKLKET